MRANLVDELRARGAQADATTSSSGALGRLLRDAAAAIEELQSTVRNLGVALDASQARREALRQAGREQMEGATQ